MLTLNGTLSFVRPSSHGDLKLSGRSASVSHSKSGCSAVYNSVEGHHTQKQHVHSHKVSFTRVSHHLYKSLKERTTRHWLVFVSSRSSINLAIFITIISSKAFCCMQHRFHANASMDDDFRSSRNIAISLFKRYKNVIDRGGGDNLKEFVSAGVQAYALGCTDEGLRKELMDIKDSGVEIEGLGTYGGTGLKFKIHSSEVSMHTT
ncbi:hypothetical protein PR202_gb10996 [Eleusine coracana subsp. coracana]|uniref:DUF7876 domain-containing protein n=1 Tax=Eleusine coracana subsp. coracana TaxID=191504 RepID=A0AAV5EJ28_ELECO|nr:hypothetical protein PR202_gb10996 [Eleusine coracana subsp. coracana]